jgi:pantoate--beta-alanine ligase
MILFKKTADFHKWLEIQRKKVISVGFVPTMGALHTGHISLIDTSKKENNITICSIFVNSAQFNDPKDFKKYPITLEKDIYLLEKSGCDVLFLPSEQEVYPDGITQKIHYDLGYLETVLEGKYRPGHFQGVCMVVHRLLDIVHPDQLYLGQKDYQQCMVITRLIGLTGQKIKVTICPTLREDDGLAMSSRNMRLNDEERKKAVSIFQNLKMIKENLKKGNLDRLIQKAKSNLEKEGLKIDYVETANAKNLSIINDWDGKQKLAALVAASVNEVRLIDNMLLN